MKTKVLLRLSLRFVALTLWVVPVLADLNSPAGDWRTIDDKTGEAKSIITLWEENGMLYGKIAEILNPAKKAAVCSECEGALKDQPIVGMRIIWGLKKDGDEWAQGKILDPSSGEIYKSKIKLSDTGNQAGGAWPISAFPGSGVLESGSESNKPNTGLVVVRNAYSLRLGLSGVLHPHDM